LIVNINVGRNSDLGPEEERQRILGWRESIQENICIGNLAVFAVRYACTRKAGADLMVANSIVGLIKRLPERDLKQIRDELQREIERGNADGDTWERVFNVINGLPFSLD
jgi:hypothetical protein